MEGKSLKYVWRRRPKDVPKAKKKYISHEVGSGRV